MFVKSDIRCEISVILNVLLSTHVVVGKRIYILYKKNSSHAARAVSKQGPKVPRGDANCITST